MREALLARFKAHGRCGGAADQASPGLVMLLLLQATSWLPHLSGLRWEVFFAQQCPL